MIEVQVLDRDIDRNEQEQHQKKALSKRVRGEYCGNDGVVAASFELLLSQSGECCSLAGVTSRRITGAKRHAVVDTNATDLGLMDRARVVATWSRSSKGVDGIGLLPVPRKFDLIAQANRHGVSDIDSDDLRPTSSHFMQGVGDRDPFFEDQHFRADEDQVAASYDECCPDGSGDTTCEGEVAETLVGVDQGTECCKREEDISTAWSEDHRISHGQIISRRGL